MNDGAGTEYDLRTTAELVDLINRHDLSVPSAVRLSAPAIERAVDSIVERLTQGGRLIYVGAGSSGRLAELDAFECAATFGVQGEIVAVVAAGLEADPLEAAAAEDDHEAGAADVLSLTLSEADVVVGVSASGQTRYVSGALSAASRAGALTVALVCSTGSEHAALADQAIEVSVGPELISGSTRLKAGTAQKLVLNTISTVAMIRLGRTFGNLMVGVAPANEKLRARLRRVVAAATGAPEDRVDEALEASGGDGKVAVVSLLAGVDTETAAARLRDANGNVRQAAG
ncbi:MAG TPA: N-acetylmuramic acid 6-phosphate etherase [Gaiellaceae bacterium]|nr:N-acetylmuramic acid 6-phosphate etherase [Gaiellaceae bacterium]